MIFVNSMSDLFHEDIPPDYIADVFDVMVLAGHHTFQILTKRHERLADLAPELAWPDHVWMGVTIENRRFVHRADYLRGVPAAVRFISAVEAATVRLSRYGRRCAEGSFAGLYLVDRRSGVLAVTRFTTHLRRHRLELRRRFRYGALLRVRAASFTMSRLLAVQRRIEDDDAYLRSRGIEVGATDVDVVRNRVDIELRRAPSGTGRYLSHRYRGAVRVYRT